MNESNITYVTITPTLCFCGEKFADLPDAHEQLSFKEQDLIEIYLNKSKG